MSYQLPQARGALYRGETSRGDDPVQVFLDYGEWSALFFVLAIVIAWMPLRKLSYNPLRWYWDVMTYATRYPLVRYYLVLGSLVVSALLLFAAVGIYFEHLLSR
jgi:hypothetical protein